MSPRIWGAAVAGTILAGCAQFQTYQPAPLDAARLPAEVAARRLEARPDGAAWTGSELLSLALSRNAQVAAAAARYRTALAAARTARQPAAATLTLTTEYSRDAGGSSPWLWGLGTDFPLDFGTRRQARLSTADLAALQALYDYGEVVWSVRIALERARAELVLADEAITLAEQAAALRRARYDRLAQRVAAGEDARSVTLVAQAELALADRRGADARARRETALTALSRALEMDPVAVRTLQLAQAPPASDLAPLPAWRTEAALTRRDVLRAVADYDLAEIALRLEIARQYPEVRLGPGYTWERGVTKLPFNLSLVLPPYDLNRSAIAQAEARRADAGRSLEAVQSVVLAGVDQAATALANARAAQVLIETRDLPLARQMTANIRRGVTGGAFDRVDQLQAEAAEAETLFAAAEARRAVRLAEVDLQDALRRAFDPAETAVLTAAVSPQAASPNGAKP